MCDANHFLYRTDFHALYVIRKLEGAQQASARRSQLVIVVFEKQAVTLIHQMFQQD